MKLLVLFLLLCATMAHGKEDPEVEPTSGTLEKPSELYELGERVDILKDGDREMDDIEVRPINIDEIEVIEGPKDIRFPELPIRVPVPDDDCVGKCLPRRWCANGGIKYMYVPTAMDWAQAQRYCQRLGGSLAAVHNRQVNFFLSLLTQGTVAWIGFSDAQRNGFWFWINGDRLVYTNWCRGEPNNVGRNQECAAINWTGAKCWDDRKCDTNLPFVCEKK